jgi:plastocyanin
MKRLLLVLPLAVALLAGTAIACGDSDDEGVGAGPAAPTQPPAQAVQEITVRGIESGEQYLFDPKTVNVRPGTVRVNFVNAGVERPHTFVVKTKAGDADLPNANTDRVELGQSKVIEFTVTEEGAYKIVCTIRGHEDRGMTGTLNVSRQTALGQ